MKKLIRLMVWLIALQFLLCTCPMEEDDYTFKVTFRIPWVFCLFNDCQQHPPKHFTVDSLKLSEGGYEEKLLPDYVLDACKEQLETWWPSLLLRDFDVARKYWKASYKKSGHSGKTTFSPEEFIQLAVSLGEEYSQRLMLFLESNGITTYGRYTPKEVGESIIQETEAKPEIVCRLIKGHYYLYKIALCFNSYKLIVDCFKSDPNYCPNVLQVYFAT